MKFLIWIAKMYFDMLFGNKQFRLMQIFSSSGVTLIVGTELFRGLFNGDFGLNTGWVYVMLVGVISMMIAFKLLCYEGGIQVHPLLARQMKAKPVPKDIDYLKSISSKWGMEQAHALFVLTREKGIAPYWATRWAGVFGYSDIPTDELFNHVPTMIKMEIAPARFMAMWDVGIHDFELNAKFAEADIDTSTAKAIMESSPTLSD